MKPTAPKAKDTDYLTGVWVRMRTKFNSYYETKEWIEKTDAYVEINNGLYLYRNVWFDWPVWEDGVTIDIKYLWESTKISLIIGIHITISEDRFRDCFPYIKYKDDTKK
jgi:hypothetical protein